jgi:hypothetical protein
VFKGKGKAKGKSGSRYRCICKEGFLPGDDPERCTATTSPTQEPTREPTTGLTEAPTKNGASCADNHCNGKGDCSALEGTDLAIDKADLAAEEVFCNCDEGWHGSKCQYMICPTPTKVTVGGVEVEIGADAGGSECSDHGYCVSTFNRAPGPSPAAGAGTFVSPKCSCFSGYSGDACEDTSTENSSVSLEQEWEADKDVGISIQVLTEPPSEVIIEEGGSILSPPPTFRLVADDDNQLTMPTSAWWATGVGEEGETARLTEPTGLLVRVLIDPEPLSIVPVGAYAFADPITGEVTFEQLHFGGVRGQSYDLRFVATTPEGKRAVAGPFPVMVFPCPEGSKTDPDDPEGCICIPGYGLHGFGMPEWDEDEGMVNPEGEIIETRRGRHRRSRLLRAGFHKADERDELGSRHEEHGKHTSEMLTCQVCLAGSYSDHDGYNPCIPCSFEGEPSMWTEGEGATSFAECKPAGCTDQMAFNYDEAAHVSVSDESCVYKILTLTGGDGGEGGAADEDDEDDEDDDYVEAWLDEGGYYYYDDIEGKTAEATEEEVGAGGDGGGGWTDGDGGSELEEIDEVVAEEEVVVEQGGEPQEGDKLNLVDMPEVHDLHAHAVIAYAAPHVLTYAFLFPHSMLPTSSWTRLLAWTPMETNSSARRSC